MRNEFILAVLKAARYDMEHRATKAAVMEVIKRGVRKCVSEPDRVAINAMQDRIAEAMESSRLKAPMLAQIETEIWAIEQAIFEHEEALIVSASSEDVQTTEALNGEELRMKNISVPASQMEVGKAYKIAGFNTNRAFIKIDAEQAKAISTILPGVDDTLMILDLSSGEVTHISSDVAMCECASYQAEEEQA